MALKKPTPAFENENSGVATAETPNEAAVNAVMGDAPAPAVTAPAPAADAAQPDVDHAKVAGTFAIAKAASSAVSTQSAASKAKEFKKEVAEMRGLDKFDFGNFPVFKGNNGEIAGKIDGAEVSMGRYVKVRLMSWDDHHEMSPGESGASSKDYVAYSKDGKTIDSVIGSELKDWVGKSVADYMTFLKEEEGFKLAKNRRFIDTACAILATDSGDGPIGKVVQISLSPSSLGAFDRYQTDLVTNARCVEMGLPGFVMREDPFQFYFIREVAAKGSDKWTKLRIEATLPAKV